MSQLAAAEQRSVLPEGSLFAMNAWVIFGGVSFIYLFFNWYLQSQVLTDDMYRYSLGGQVNPDKLTAFLEGQHRMVVLSYILVPVMLLMRMTLISLCIYAGLVLTSQNLVFTRVFRIVLFAESAFVAGTLVRLLILAFSKSVETLGQYMAFAPLSLYSLLHGVAVPNWLSYPLQTLDVFQVGYCILLARGLQYYTNRSFRESLRLVLGTYGIGLAMCMIGFAFISVVYNP